MKTNKLTHLSKNPLIQEATSDTLASVKAVLQCIQEFTHADKVSDEIILRHPETYGLYCINQCMLDALQYEVEKNIGRLS